MNVDKSFNTSISEAKNIISILKKNYVDKKIMVITDYVGAKYFKKKLGKIKNLYYSRNFIFRRFCVIIKSQHCFFRKLD